MPEKTMPITGGCLCGAVRYLSTKAPVDVSFCHCRMCQKSSGNPYFLSAFIPKKTFRFTISAIIFGWLILGETLLTNHLIGMTIITLGLLAIDGRLWAGRSL